MRSQFLNVDERVEAAKIKKRPISAGAGRPNRLAYLGRLARGVSPLEAYSSCERGCWKKPSDGDADTGRRGGKFAFSFPDIGPPPEQVRRNAGPYAGWHVWKRTRPSDL